CQQGYSYPYSF
nr:immunoglobulin light chain junction region [Macaca mulatta]MOV78359.1 immunoglobulin light chain junction region [Macaca mulatta]MOV78574.1 immunoglobulin light chain junction region [Macaca mulatta]MOV79113.1 immunoglobulin light chain junction region [Macaca mulatta]MOV79122.1 immunoglobulin light chain junction region [Macaca mulatta]